MWSNDSGILGKPVRVRTHTERLHSVPEAVENKQSFLSRPGRVWTRSPGSPSRRYQDMERWKGGTDARDFWRQKRQDLGLCVCGREKEPKRTPRKSWSRQSASPGSTARQAPQSILKSESHWSSALTEHLLPVPGIPLTMPRRHMGKKIPVLQELTLDLSLLLFPCVSTFHQKRSISGTRLSLSVRPSLLWKHQLAQVKNLQVLSLSGFTHSFLMANKSSGMPSPQRWPWDCKMWTFKFNKCHRGPTSIKWTYGTFPQRTLQYSRLFIHWINM